MNTLPQSILERLEVTSVDCPNCPGRLEIISPQEVYCPECGRFFAVVHPAVVPMAGALIKEV